MSNQKTKGWPRLAVCVAACFLIMSTLAQFGFPQQTDVHVTIEMPPKYSLWEGVDVAIKSFIDRGVIPTVNNILKELEGMEDRHEVRLPYSYSSPFSRKYLKADEKKKKNEFAAKVAKRLAVALSEHPELASAIPAEPQPKQFKTKKEFVDAYSSYKVKNSDDDIKAKYAKKMNGMNAYRFEMKREAERIWKEAQKQ